MLVYTTDSGGIGADRCHTCHVSQGADGRTQEVQFRLSRQAEISFSPYCRSTVVA